MRFIITIRKIPTTEPKTSQAPNAVKSPSEGPSGRFWNFISRPTGSCEQALSSISETQRIQWQGAPSLRTADPQNVKALRDGLGLLGVQES